MYVQCMTYMYMYVGMYIDYMYVYMYDCMYACMFIRKGMYEFIIRGFFM